ncbi:hypothetical protein BDM02DRAFT_3108416 [Thelephora ganbajun]|uniref:Uncharacterized protein n=1 Tax=Thelephora ganbajun TaxID=370292 RepID=A0ACB6ZUY1_THEGA|nr:hypothetical protein BDM02DRAFT_3108416 [Thelephora ganbajun]
MDNIIRQSFSPRDLRSSRSEGSEEKRVAKKRVSSSVPPRRDCRSFPAPLIPVVIVPATGL